jgi:DNA-binding protein
VKYYRSDEWETNRGETQLAVSNGLMQTVMTYLMGSALVLNDKEFITALKARQRKITRELDLVQYLRPLAGKEVTAHDIEALLLRSMLNELVEVFNIPPPDDRDAFLEGIMVMRSMIAEGFGSPLIAIWRLVSNRAKMAEMRRYFSSLSKPDMTIVQVPLLTTVDTTMLSILTNQNAVSSFHELFALVPVKMLPFYHNGEMVVLDIVANEQDNPGNSAFGPKGVICPGNIVTSMVLKSVMQLKAEMEFPIAPGSPAPDLPEGRPFAVISNGRDVRVLPKLREQK